MLRLKFAAGFLLGLALQPVGIVTLLRHPLVGFFTVREFWKRFQAAAEKTDRVKHLERYRGK